MAGQWARLETLSPHWPSFVLKRSAQGVERAVVGRKKACEVSITDPHMSNIHLVIEAAGTGPEGPTAWLLDKSTNGSFHNGAKIGNGNKVLAKSGDLVSFVVVPSLEANGCYSVPDPDLV